MGGEFMGLLTWDKLEGLERKLEGIEKHLGSLETKIDTFTKENKLNKKS